MGISSMPRILDMAPTAVILAYRENTAELTSVLQHEGFSVETQRASYSESQLEYSRTIRCLMNHRDAWLAASLRQTCTLIVESDFVPCRGMGAMPAPFSPDRHGPLAWAFLYAGGPRIIQIHADGYLEGHACCPVAVLVTPGAATILAAFADEELATHDPHKHSLWDTYFQWHAMGKQARCFLPYRNYGEHGGIVNPEHRSAQIGWISCLPFLSRSVFLNNHHAECLAAPLAFLPTYARGSLWRFHLQRLIAWMIGCVRVIMGRVGAPAQKLSWRTKCRIHWLSVRRLIW